MISDNNSKTHEKENQIIHGETMVSEEVIEKEFGNIKKKAIGKSKQFAARSTTAFGRITNNWDILVGILLLAYGMYLLYDIFFGLLLIIGGLLFLLGYIKKWMYSETNDDTNDDA